MLLRRRRTVIFVSSLAVRVLICILLCWLGGCAFSPLMKSVKRTSNFDHFSCGEGCPHAMKP